MSDVRADAFGNMAKEESYSVNSGEEAISNKMINGMPIDRLSALPDDILIHILSGLGFDVKHSAATCVLSKRWKFLWTEMPKLNFREYSGDPEKTSHFVSLVYMTIILRSSSYVDQFSVEFFYNECYALDVNVWILFALKNKVKDLNIKLRSEVCFYTPPQLLYSDSSLTQMSLRRCILAPPEKIEWPHLSYLRVEDVELSQEVLEKILSGSPVLGCLYLIDCGGYNNISSESLRELEVSDGNDGNNVDLLEISTPCLSSLVIYFSPRDKKLRLTNLPSSLDRANFFYTDYDDSVETMNFTMELLEKTKHAKLLILGGIFVEAVFDMLMRGWQLPQSRRLGLELEIPRHENIIQGILCLLESSPNLQNLILERLDPYEESDMLWVPSPRNDLDYDLLNLKTVQLFNIADPMFDGEPMLTMTRILLKRATTLEKMEIKLEDLGDVLLDFNEMFEMVLSYPRSSEEAVVIFLLSTDEDEV